MPRMSQPAKIEPDDGANEGEGNTVCEENLCDTIWGAFGEAADGEKGADDNGFVTGGNAVFQGFQQWCEGRAAKTGG